MHIIQKNRFLSLHFTLNLIKAIKELYLDQISLYSDSLNRMFGNDLLERYIRGHLGYNDLTAKIKKDEDLFIQQRQKYLLYD